MSEEVEQPLDVADDPVEPPERQLKNQGVAVAAEALRQGADGYVLRRAPLGHLAFAVDQLEQRTIY